MIFKKILLGFGAALLTLLPITTMISCSSPSVENIDDEVKKFNAPTITKKEITSQEAVLNITNASTAQEKRIALLDFASVPTLDSEFDFEVLSANIDNTVKSTVNVMMKVFEISDKTNAKNVTYKVEGFIVITSTIEIEAAKFDKQVNTKKPELNSIEAAEMFENKNPSESLAALKELADIPTLVEGFGFVITRVNVDSTTNTMINVFITVSGAIATETKNVTFRVAGFQPGISIDNEVKKFDNQVNTKRSELTSIQAIEMIEGKSSSESLIALHELADVPILTEGFSFEVTGANINITTRTVIDVAITVFGPIANETRNTTFRVGGFQSGVNIDNEADKFNTTVETTNPTTSSETAVESIQMSGTPEEKLSVLETFANVPTLDFEFDFEILSANIDNQIKTTINVQVKVFEIANPGNFKEVTFKVIGLTSLLEREAANFNTSVITTNPAMASETAVESIQMSGTPEEKLSALEAFANVPTLDPRFNFEILSANVDNQTKTTVNVQVKVFEIANPGNFKEVTFRVIGLTTLIEIEAGRFNTSVMTTNPTMASTTAVNNIQSAGTPGEKLTALKSFANVPTLDPRFEVEILAAEVDDQVNTTVNVRVKIFEKINSGNSREVTFKVTNLQPGVNIDNEADKFNITVGTTNATMASEIAVESIQISGTPEEKLSALEVFANVPTLDPRFNFEILSAEVDDQVNTTVNVQVKVFEIANAENFKEVTFRVTGLTTLLEIEAGRFNTSVITTKPTTASEHAMESIENAVNAADKLTALKVFANVPILDQRFDVEILSSEVDGQVNTTVNVQIKIFEKINPENFKEVTFKVTGLTTRIEIQAAKFIYSQSSRIPPGELYTFKTVQAVQRVNLAPAGQERFNALSTFTRAGFLPTLDDGFAYEILYSRVSNFPASGTAMKVDMRIFEINNPANDKIISPELIDFAPLSALDLQLKQFIDIVPTKIGNITALAAIDSLLVSTDQDTRKEALNLLADVPTLPSNFTYEVKDAQISRRDPNEIYVTITVIENPGTNNWSEDVIFAINGFRAA
ncbi:MAG: hypothetical protein ACRCW3_03845 [Metamycoplasmataceae bacterium]